VDEDQRTTKRWGVKRKVEVVMRLLRGEPLDRVSRETGVEISRLEEWKREALSGMECGLRSRPESLESRELNRAKRQIGELTMKVEILEEGLRMRDPFTRKRSKS